MFRRICVTLTIAAASAGTAWSCLWDYDTLEMERSRFPSALELIAGKFRRHSTAFYEWRIEDRLGRLETASESEQPELYDDLAVAYENTGQTERAIEVTLELEEKFPDRYETAANLGTFYIHARQFDEGLKHIERALEINPEAHFGRERYQKLLVEYVISKSPDGEIRLPLNESKSTDSYQGFAAFVLEARDLDLSRISKEHFDTYKEEMHSATQGVLGMLRFGNYRSPVLLEALGDLLCASYDGQSDAKQLAARAFLRAADAVAPPSDSADSPAQWYRQKAARSLRMQLRPGGTGSSDELELADIEQQLTIEVAEADAWFAELQENETRWIAEGSNPDEEYSALYHSAPLAKSTKATPAASSTRNSSKLILMAVAVGLLAVVIASILLSRSKPKSETSP